MHTEVLISQAYELSPSPTQSETSQRDCDTVVQLSPTVHVLEAEFKQGVGGDMGPAGTHHGTGGIPLGRIRVVFLGILTTAILKAKALAISSAEIYLQSFSLSQGVKTAALEKTSTKQSLFVIQTKRRYICLIKDGRPHLLQYSRRKIQTLKGDPSNTMDSPSLGV